MFRTGILRADRRKLDDTNSSCDYATTIKAYNDRLIGADGRQPGDPNMAAQRIVELARLEGHFKQRLKIPFRIFLGSDCFKVVQEKCLATLEALDEARDLSFSTDFAADELADIES